MEIINGASPCPAVAIRIEQSEYCTFKYCMPLLWSDDAMEGNVGGGNALAAVFILEAPVLGNAGFYYSGECNSKPDIT